MLVDSHCHLEFDEFAEDLDGVVQRAGDAGVGHIVTISTRVKRFAKIKAVADRFENMSCTIGTHPHNADEEEDVSSEELVEISKDPKVIGIGETGLDYFYDNAPRDIQRRQFRKHIAASRETGLPLIIHTRDADDDMAEILTDEMGKGAFPAVFHCFSSSRKLADIGLELGLTLSISGILTFKKAEELRDVARDAPLDRLLVETDAPFLAPVPHRGKRNEPSFVAETAKMLAEIKGCSVEEITEITTKNFFTLFRKAPQPVL